MKILVVNAGSSSLKYQLIDTETEKALAKGLCERIGIDGRFKHSAGDKEIVLEEALPDHGKAIAMVLKYLTDATYGVIQSVSEIAAVGHRVVNGGEVFSESCIMDEEKIQKLEELTEFAPLHNPPAVIGLRACIAAMGEEIPQICVFDTSFHQSMPPVASVYGLPYEYYEKYGIRRFGAHGTSHKYVARRCAAMLGKDVKDMKIITCHLGNGSSITAVKNGDSIDTSMGFTPLAGPLMGTRCGDIDPAIVTYIMQKENKTPAEMSNLMNKESGVQGISGVSSDFRDVEAGMNEGNKRCALALDMFNYQVLKYIGAYTAAMGGLDAIVFTAGIGENNQLMRTQLTDMLGYMGVEIDAEKNKIRGEEIDISTPASKVRVCVIPTNEELAIAQDTRDLVLGMKK